MFRVQKINLNKPMCV